MENNLNRPLASLSVSEFIQLLEKHADLLQDVITLDEAAELTGYTRATLYTYANRGQIPSFKSAGRLRFSKKALSELLTKNNK